ncbi:MAG: FkbM family methyltransferase [Flavobacteriales bacterium]|jgi:FkbM family methyltransferase
MKTIIRKTLNFLHLDITQNLKYDRLTKLVMKRVIDSDSNCVDVGCHKGEILQDILKLSPNGKHFAFEPIPEMFENLKDKFGDRATLSSEAVSDRTGSTSFNWVKNAPAYSGLKERIYAVDTPDIQKVEVELDTLENVIPADVKIDFLKIDVEGGEFDVIKGGLQKLKKDQPVIVFECGLGASEYYDTDIATMYKLITDEIELKLYTLSSFINNTGALSLEEFKGFYDSNSEYYFVASK